MALFWNHSQGLIPDKQFFFFINQSAQFFIQVITQIRGHEHRSGNTEVRLITGNTHEPGERREAWSDPADIFVATPHTVRNDLRNERLDLEESPLIVFRRSPPYLGTMNIRKVEVEKPDVVIGMEKLLDRMLEDLLGKIPEWRGSWTWKEIGFLSWTGNVRGVMPVTLAGIIVVKGIEYGHLIVGLTFVTVLLTILIQASTAPVLINKWDLD